MATAFEYFLESICENAEFTLGPRQSGNPSPLLLVAPCAEPSLPQSLGHMKHEYSFSAKVESAWVRTARRWSMKSEAANGPIFWA
jgi:hypothetical protein